MKSCLKLTRKLQHKPLDIITLFHKANSPASTRVAALLKQASAAASESSAGEASKVHRPEFKLEITEQAPTADQLQTILQYAGAGRISSIIKGATNEKDALKKFQENAENFQRPVVCSFSRSWGDCKSNY